MTNKSWSRNQFELITFSSSSKKSKQVIEVEGNGGYYNGSPDLRMITFTLHGLPSKPVKVSLNGIDMLPNAEWLADRSALQLKILYRGDLERLVFRYE